jgi:alpha-galactosidase
MYKMTSLWPSGTNPVLQKQMINRAGNKDLHHPKPTVEHVGSATNPDARRSTIVQVSVKIRH